MKERKNILYFLGIGIVVSFILILLLWCVAIVASLMSRYDYVQSDDGFDYLIRYPIKKAAVGGYMYDPESGYNHTSYYPTPASVIPTSHYLKAVELGQGNGWALSVSAPALVIFQTHGMTPAEFANNTANQWYDGGNVGNQIWTCVKVPNEWIVDALEVFSSGYKDSSMKRLTADIDAGYVWLTN